MRVTAFVTLILIATTLSGCSHRRGVQVNSSPRICKCVQCGEAQRRMMANKTVPTEHFTNDDFEGQGESFDSDESTEQADLTAPNQSILGSPAVLENGVSGDDKYFAEPPVLVEPSNPTENSATTPQLLPIIPAINDSIPPFVPEIPSETIESTPAEQTGPTLDPPQLPTEELGEVEEADGELALPKSDNESASFDMETFPRPNVDSSLQSPIALTSPNRQVLRPALIDLPAISPPHRISDQSTLRPDHGPSFFPSEPVIRQPLVVDQVEIAAAAEQTAPHRTSEDGARQTVILHARPVAGVVIPHHLPKRAPNPTPVPTSKADPTASANIAASNRITNNSTVDPVYGLPLTNEVHFGALPEIHSNANEFTTSTAAVTKADAATKDGSQPVEKSSCSASENLALKNEVECSQNHFHVHFHAAPNAKPIPGRDRQFGCDTCGIDGKAVQVVYRDEEGRVIMAPPTKADSLESSAASPRIPSGDRQTYYIPPQPILRLKATTPIGQPKTDPSVASILMRDTVTIGGTHLLSIPVRRGKNGMPQNINPLIEQNRVIIDHDQLREALQRLAPRDQSSQELKR